jgi:tetratricopeptide (TPR) repeat protein
MINDMSKEGKIASPPLVPASSSSLVQQTPEKDQLGRMRIIYSALDNEDRLRIIFTIFNEPDISFNDISKKTGIDKPALAYHLGVLKRAGLVEMVYQKRGKKLTKYRITDEGKRILEKALEIDPYYAEAWYNKGLVYYKMKKYNEALECYNKALEIDPYYAEAWNNKGNVYYKMKEYNEALECYNKALEINSFDAGAWNNKGNVYYKMKKYNEALECYEEAIKLNPYYAEAWYNKGLVYYEMKKYDEAIKCYNKATDINPYDAKVWNNKAGVYIEMKKYDEASKCFMKIFSLFIINQEHIELIPKLLNFLIKNSKDEVIKAEASAIGITLLYLSKNLPKEKYIKELNSLKKTPRIEVLIDAIINKKDIPMEIKDVVDKVFDLLKKEVLRSV